MEKLFQPSKWLVLFCAVFLVVWGAAQYLLEGTLKEVAQHYAASIFTWDWPGDGWQSRVEITGTQVIRRTDHDAIVKVQGKQHLTQAQSDGKLDGSEAVDCAAILTFYGKRNDKNVLQWQLGEVELQ